MMSSSAAVPDLIVHHGKIVSVDPAFTIHEAMAIRGNAIIELGPSERILQTKGPETRVVDLEGKTVLPGLIDSHVHPEASMTEFDHPIPDMETIADVLQYIRQRAQAVPEGKWIVVRQIFITRLKEQRYPTRAELDEAAPKHPVMFATGPDASLNSLALKLSGIDRNFEVSDGGPGYVEKDPATGEPTGILRSCTRYVKADSSASQPSERDYEERIVQLFRDYNATGFTCVADKSSDWVWLERYERLLSSGRLPVRLMLSHHIATLGPLAEIQEQIRAVARSPRTREDPRLQIIGIKTFLDGGMLTGSAYMRQPWGLSRIYGITDPDYRGVLFIPPDRLRAIVQTAVESGLQFTAHSVGDGAVHTLLDAYEAVNRTTPVRKFRPCITHSNFMSREAVEKAAALGVVVDIQPAWLYLDTRTLLAQFGYDRLRYFQPLRSLFEAGAIAGGGSDHMQKIGSLRSINPYNPFLGMWVTMKRQAKWQDKPLHPEEALTREQAIRFYTINNAFLLFKEKQIGSLEPGKLADFIILDRDILTCPLDEVKETRVLETYLDGKQVYRADKKS